MEDLPLISFVAKLRAKIDTSLTREYLFRVLFQVIQLSPYAPILLPSCIFAVNFIMKFLISFLLTFPCILPLFLAIETIPEMDISFVISATAIDANTNFKTMKGVVQAAIDRYGADRLRYSVVVFGNIPALQLQFTSKFPSDEDFKKFVENIPRKSGTALDKSLELARNEFNRNSRSGAKKVGNVRQFFRGH